MNVMKINRKRTSETRKTYENSVKLGNSYLNLNPVKPERTRIIGLTSLKINQLNTTTIKTPIQLSKNQEKKTQLNSIKVLNQTGKSQVTSAWMRQSTSRSAMRALSRT